VIRVLCPAQHIIGHFGDESCTGTDNLKQTAENTQKKQKINKLALGK